MIKKILLTLLLTCLLSEGHSRVYQQLDNQTLASIEDVIDDPFLAIRTHVDNTGDIIDSWLEFAQIEMISPFGTSEDLSPLIEDQSSGTDSAHIAIRQTLDVFDHIVPRFNLEKTGVVEQMQWQISADADFSVIIPNFNKTHPYQDQISLDLLSETFLNNNTLYFLRVRSLSNGVWSQWTPSFSFKVIKPETPSEITFTKLGDKQYQIKWEANPGQLVLVYASNSIDFVPSLYTDKHVNGKVELETNENLVRMTTDSQIQIDGTFAYYRIIAADNNAYSVPSPLIYVYDSELNQSRNVLQSVGEDIKRIEFPKAYSYLSDPVFSQEFAEEFRHVKSPHVDEETWQKVLPYLLPANHPIKNKLDALFSKTRVLANSNTLSQAGFENTKPGQFSNAVVTKHPKFKGYYFKLFKDDQLGLSDWKQWKTRVTGANSVREAIIRHHWQSMFKVPHKWIYPVPPQPDSAPGSERKNFILIAENMHILGKHDNKAYWRSKHVDEELLDALYILLQEEGLVDSVYAFNLPFGRDGKVAFIDTEKHHKWPIPFYKLGQYLSSEMKNYWHHLIDQGGPK